MAMTSSTGPGASWRSRWAGWPASPRRFFCSAVCALLNAGAREADCAEAPVPAGIRRRDFDLAPLAAYLGLALALLLTALERLWLQLAPPGAYYARMLELYQTQGRALDAFGAFVTIGLVAPLASEFLFRGLMLGLAPLPSAHATPAEPPAAPDSADGRTRAALWFAVVLQAALFALLSLNPWQFVGLFIAGLTFAALRIAGRSVVPAAVAHVTLALFSIYVHYYAPTLPLFGDARPDDADPFMPAGLAVGVVAVAAGLYWLRFTVVRRRAS
jgi:membrane protease YdiL (CAAX protease family)